MKKRYIFLLLGLFKLPLIFVLVILLMVPSNLSSTSNHNCPNSNINAGGHPFSEDYSATQGFGTNEFGLYSGGHSGVDLVPVRKRDYTKEEATIHTISDGKVITAGSDLSGWGNYVAIQMGDKKVYYAHLTRHSVKTGDEVKKGQEIGVMGDTGYSFGAHLHLQVINSSGSNENPSEYLGKDNIKTGDIFRVSSSGENTDIKQVSSCGNSIDTNLEGNDNAEKTWNFYIKQGFSEEATAGIMGNFMQESRLDPNIVEFGNGIGYGIAQWSFTRRTDLENWAKGNFKDVKLLSTQLEFTMIEMNKMSFTENYKKITDVYEATDIFQKEYERAGTVHMANRLKYAEEIYKKYKGKSV